MAFLSLDKRRERKEHVTVVVLSLANCYFSYDDADRFAAILNERGMSSGEGKSFTVRIVARIKRNYSLTPRYDRLRKAGMLTVEEMAALLGIRPQSVKIWKQHGLVRGHAYNDKNAEQISANISVRWGPDGILAYHT